MTSSAVPSVSCHSSQSARVRQEEKKQGLNESVAFKASYKKVVSIVDYTVTDEADLFEENSIYILLNISPILYFVFIGMKHDITKSNI